MATFFGALALISGSLLLLSIPVFVLAWRRRRIPLARKFAIAALAIGLFFATASVGSERLVDNCRASGGVACLDSGYAGFLFLVGIIYVIAVATATYVLVNQ